MINSRKPILAKDLINGMIPFVKTTGNTNDYIITYEGITSYYEGLRFCIKIN